MALNKDVELDEDESTYECYRCGTIVVSAQNPGDCDDCGSRFRHRGVPLE
ncbi:rubrerythrin-like domain-containing protein [Haloarchaeobius sp. DFWS5]